MQGYSTDVLTECPFSFVTGTSELTGKPSPIVFGSSLQAGYERLGPTLNCAYVRLMIFSTSCEEAERGGIGEQVRCNSPAVTPHLAS